MPQLIGVPRETAAGEKRVATVPEVVEKLIKLGFRVAVESGAGVVRGQRLQHSPGRRHWSLCNVRQRQRFDDLIPDELILVARYRHHRQDGDNADHHHQFDQREAGVANIAAAAGRIG